MSISDILRQEAAKRGLSHSRKDLIETGVILRREMDNPAATVIAGIETWEEKPDRYPRGVAVSSVRVVTEALYISRHGRLWYVDAPPEKRFEWGRERQRGEESFGNAEEMLQAERYELYGMGGMDRPHHLAIRWLANHLFWNGGSENDLLAEVHREL